MKVSIKYFLLLVILSLLLTSCGSRLKNEAFTPVILDSEGLLNQSTISWLNSYSYPQGFIFIIRTINSVSPIAIGVNADEYFKADAEKCPDPNACKKRGVYIFITRAPALIQVRAGTEIAAQARWQGITAGESYIQKQSVVLSGDFDTSTIEMVKWLSSSLPNTKVPWYREWILNDVTQNLYLELNEVGFPSESFYGHYIVKPIIQARVLESRLTGSWWITYLVAGIIILLIKSLVQSLIKLFLGKPFPKIANGINTVIGILIEIGLTLPSAATIIFLSGSRLEDQIALQASGIPGVSSFSFSAQLFNVETGIGWAILVLCLRWWGGYGKSSDIIALSQLPPEKQQLIYARIRDENPVNAFLIEAYARAPYKEGGNFYPEIFEKQPFSLAELGWGTENFKAGVRWGLLAWLALPKALSLVMIFLWISWIIEGIIGFIKIELQLNKAGLI